MPPSISLARVEKSLGPSFSRLFRSSVALYWAGSHAPCDACIDVLVRLNTEYRELM